MTYSVSRLTLRDGGEAFDVTVVEPAERSRVALFAVGGGGNPERHLPLLTALAEQGCTVVAPHFARLAAAKPNDEELLLRARRLSLSLDSTAPAGMLVAGVGHSIGATTLLALAGGQIWMRPGHQLAIAADGRLDRLALMAPATQFFQAPHALDAVHTPILVWAASKDVITPPDHASFLEQSLRDRVPVEARLVEGAGHFSFMNQPPPQTSEPLADRDAFLAALTDEVCRFVTR